MKAATIDINRLKRTLERHDPLTYTGRISRVVGVTVECTGITAALGELCEIRTPGSREPSVSCLAW